jgi:hypothetical protein
MSALLQKKRIFLRRVDDGESLEGLWTGSVECDQTSYRSGLAQAMRMVRWRAYLFDERFGVALVASLGPTMEVLRERFE